MKRLVCLTAGIVFLLSTGCKNDGEWSVRKALGVPEPQASTATLSKKDIPRARPEIAERVQLIGRQIVSRNVFISIDPDKLLFFTIGMKELVLFHRGTNELFISEGVVDKCKSDAELTAVLCGELGKMVAEAKAAKTMGHDVDPVPDPNFGGNTVQPGGTPFDMGREAELAFHAKKYPRAAATATATARDLLKGAGYSPAELDRVEPLLKNSDRGEKLRKQMGGSAPAPTWEN